MDFERGQSAKQVKVVLADDHQLVRTGFRLLVEEMQDFEIVAETMDGISTIKAVEQYAPDLLILDLQMPNLGGVEVLKRLAKEEAAPAVLVVSAAEPGLFVSEAFSAGASGYLKKDASRGEFESAVRSILDGKKYVSPAIAEYLVQKDGAAGPLGQLTSREREVFKLLAEGRKNKEIAKMLFVSIRTIDTHRLNILKKLNLQTNAELAQLAMKYGVI